MAVDRLTSIVALTHKMTLVVEKKVLPVRRDFRGGGGSGGGGEHPDRAMLDAAQADVSYSSLLAEYASLFLDFNFSQSIVRTRSLNQPLYVYHSNVWKQTLTYVAHVSATRSTSRLDSHQWNDKLRNVHCTEAQSSTIQKLSAANAPICGGESASPVQCLSYKFTFFLVLL
jgi:hypothetical protein